MDLKGKVGVTTYTHGETGYVHDIYLLESHVQVKGRLDTTGLLELIPTIDAVELDDDAINELQDGGVYTHNNDNVVVLEWDKPEDECGCGYWPCLMANLVKLYGDHVKRFDRLLIRGT